MTNKIILAAFAFAALIMPASFANADQDEEITIEQASMADMDESRGAAAENNLVSSQTLSATATGNTVNVTGDLLTGGINIGDGFGADALGSYVLNTGNNTAINSAVSVNVQMAPASP